MTRDALLAELMRLPADERRAVALEVLEHSDDDEPMHPDIEASHRAELDRRLQLIDAGLMKYSPWDEVRARLFGRDG